MHKALGPSPQFSLPPSNLISLASRGIHFLQSHISQVCSMTKLLAPWLRSGRPSGCYAEEVHPSTQPGKPGFGSSGPGHSNFKRGLRSQMCITLDQAGRGPQVQ